MIALDFRSAYLLLDLPFLFLWGVLYAASRDTRREQLVMSLLLVPLGVISELVYFRDYWLPQSVASFTVLGIPVLLEDVLFGFAIGGIAAVIYEVIARRGLRRRTQGSRHGILAFVVVTATVMAAIWFAGMNSIYATSVGSLLAALYIIVQRHDLLADSLVSGVAVMATMFVVYVLLWNVVPNGPELLARTGLTDDRPLSTVVFGAPLTELLWGLAFGMMVGPAYEYLRNYRLA